MSKRLMPTYLVNFLKEIYDGTIPSNFGKRMVSRQFIARVKELYETLGGDNPSDYSRRMVNEYLIKFFDEIEIIEYTDDDVKMTKDIPSDLVYPACRVDSIGGMSYKIVNLTSTTSTTVYPQRKYIENINDFTTGTYTFHAYNNSNAEITLYLLGYYDTTYVRDLTSLTIPANSGVFKTFNFTNNNDVNAIGLYNGITTAYTQLGLYKGTVNTYIETSTILDSKVTAVKTYNTDNELLDTYTVPSAIISLEGYGQSNPDDPTELNVVNFTTGKYYEKGYIDNGVWVSKEAEISITEQAPLLEAVDSGTIVFENDYNQDMPNEVTTWIKGN